MKYKINYRPKADLKILLLLPMMMLVALYSSAQPPEAKTTSSMNNTAIMMSVIVIAALGLVIAILGAAVIAAKSVYRERIKREKEESLSAAAKIFILIGIGVAASQNAMAQVTNAAQEKDVISSDTIAGLPSNTFYLIVGVLLLELIVILALVNILKFLAGIKSKPLFSFKPRSERVHKISTVNVWWNKLNRSVAIEKEKDIDLSHDYDGIRELDNSIPPWWKWAFIATICFGVVYLWRFHIAESAPMQVEELNIAMRKAEADKQEYLKLSASKVDETTVKMLDAGGINNGKVLFTANCVACHGSNGEGNVGPNLTDDYWLHKGSINDIFKTIKYGWIDKGMKSWKDDFTPTQIAELASFVKSLHNTNPANPKAPQGELYKEAEAPADSVKNIAARHDAAQNNNK
jgi:cytochrome c oxidase cbb3-type subunit III